MCLNQAHNLTPQAGVPLLLYFLLAMAEPSFQSSKLELSESYLTFSPSSLLYFLLLRASGFYLPTYVSNISLLSIPNAVDLGPHPLLFEPVQKPLNCCPWRKPFLYQSITQFIYQIDLLIFLFLDRTKVIQIYGKTVE